MKIFPENKLAPIYMLLKNYAIVIDSSNTLRKLDSLCRECGIPWASRQYDLYDNDIEMINEHIQVNSGHACVYFKISPKTLYRVYALNERDSIKDRVKINVPQLGIIIERVAKKLNC